MNSMLNRVFPRLAVLFVLAICPALLCGQDQTTDSQSELKIDFQDREAPVTGQANLGFQVTGLSIDDVGAIKKAGLKNAASKKLFEVFVGENETAILGTLLLDGKRLVFEPRFELDRQQDYRAVFDIQSVLDENAERLPIEKKLNTVAYAEIVPARLTAVHPKLGELPQNVLRMYLQFDQEMQQGSAYDYIEFLDSNNEPIETPYLEVPQELWSTDGTRLTLLFDPGRIKRGLARHKEFGPPFEVGKTYTLVVKEGWPAADRGNLHQDYRQTFSIGEPDRIQPSVSRWTVNSPKPESLDPVEIRFAESLDVGMLQHSLQLKSLVTDSMVTTTTTVSSDGRSCLLHPKKPWASGDYVLVADPRLEDQAGNSLAKPFERRIVDGDKKIEELPNPKTELRFRIGAAIRERPNVVVILADDLGWMDLSCQGSSFYESPNIDRISKEGMRFEFGYAACQVCSPSRAAIMTGKSPARLKITDYIGAPSGTNWKRNTKLLPAFYKRNLPAEETTIAEAFHEGGYKTFFAGKWHLGSKGSFPEDHGFEVNVGGHLAGTPPGGFFVPYKNPKMKDGPAGECLPVRLGQETADFIEANQKEPFFAFLSFYSVHAPIQTSKELWEKYRVKAKFDARMPHVDNRFKIDRTMPVRQVQDHPLYAGMVESMDDGVGLVLDKLDQLGLAENTIVIFTSDNGGVSSGDGFATCNTPFRGGKGRQWEGGIREPFLVRWPSVVTAGAYNETPVIGTDIYPTLLDLAGLPARPKQTLDGVSIRRILEGGSIESRPLVWHYPHYGNQGGEPSSIIRKGDWKLIRYHEDQRLELYNLTDDFPEKTDVAKQHADRVVTMAGELDRMLVEMDAEYAVTNPNFDADSYANWKKQQVENRLPALEKKHARFHDEDFQPKGGWWDLRK